MTSRRKEHDYQKENEDQLVDLLYQATLREYPLIPIPNEELAKELLRVGIKARCRAEELTTLKEHLTPYSDEEIKKIREEKMQLVTVPEFQSVHRSLLEEQGKLKKTTKALRTACDEIKFLNGSDTILEEFEQILVEIGEGDE